MYENPKIFSDECEIKLKLKNKKIHFSILIMLIIPNFFTFSFEMAS